MLFPQLLLLPLFLDPVWAIKVNFGFAQGPSKSAELVRAQTPRSSTGTENLEAPLSQIHIV